MGFAVVAHEVRTLAHRSAQAAEDTATLIEEALESSKVTQSTAAAAEENAATSEELSAQAEKSRFKVQRLIRVVNGANATAAHDAAPSVPQPHRAAAPRQGGFKNAS